ncbi:histidine kinase [Antribacter gilvus]|uniref:histidine kinase n=1 Tax=Antribacter gilvus TaxID=2304675 RepID=UPI000F77B6B5|nr:histidine kinase [Antribacter gilvus]
MRAGSGVLAGALVATWALVYLVTQVIVSPPLAVGTTVVAGTVVSVLLVVGYPSALRGPRAATGLRRGARESARAEAGHGGTRSGRAGAGLPVRRSMPLRSGLTADAARRTAELLLPLLGGDAVAITDRETVLAFVGAGDDHHRAGATVASTLAGRVIAKGRTVVGGTPRALACADPGCRLRSAVVVPLTVGTRVVGTVGVFRAGTGPVPRDQVEDMAAILSLHVELAELDRERKLAADARLDALRAQINPHFLFNVLNTIASKSRTDPDEARQLLLRLSDFFRYAVRQEGQVAEFAQEYFFVRTYLSLEQARFGDRLRVRYDIDPQVLTAHVPVLMIQPLVENAVKHGLADKVEGGTVTLRARVDPLTRTTSIRVTDDGVGIPADVLERLTNGSPAAGEPGDDWPSGDGGPGRSGRSGVGLRNISLRLATLFGERFALDIQSSPGGGTVVDIRMPLR